jgi:hypothetical protein
MYEFGLQCNDEALRHGVVQSSSGSPHRREDSDLEAYREDPYAGMAFGMRDMRAFASEWLGELLRVLRRRPTSCAPRVSAHTGSTGRYK